MATSSLPSVTLTFVSAIYGAVYSVRHLKTYNITVWHRHTIPYTMLYCTKCMYSYGHFKYTHRSIKNLNRCIAVKTILTSLAMYVCHCHVFFHMHTKHTDGLPACMLLTL